MPSLNPLLFPELENKRRGAASKPPGVTPKLASSGPEAVADLGCIYCPSKYSMA